jgi:hypothetical protein
MGSVMTRHMRRVACMDTIIRTLKNVVSKPEEIRPRLRGMIVLKKAGNYFL